MDVAAVSVVDPGGLATFDAAIRAMRESSAILYFTLGDLADFQARGKGHARYCSRQARPDGRHERCDRHGQYRNSKEQLIGIAGKQSVIDPAPGQNKRKLPDLAEHQPHDYSSTERKAKEQSPKPGDNAFQGQDEKNDGQNSADVVDEKPDIQQHADRNKKEAHEYIPKRQNVTKGLVAVFRLGDDEAG